MEDLWHYLKTLRKPIVLYGMGNGADMVLSVCEQYGIKISGVFASEGFVRKKTFHGMPVTDYSSAKEQFGDMAVLLCFGTALPEVIKNIKRIGSECELYAPDVPVCGDTLFCREYYERRKPEFDSIREMLADEKSKRVFDGIIAFKL
ncbi:MAG: FkbM family methyltransferase, partial [Clostridia bacterium]|nr:FkbM family methyltransferase [Clostridia bacterium]